MEDWKYRMEIICRVNTNQKKAGITVITLDEVGFKVKKLD